MQVMDSPDRELPAAEDVNYWKTGASSPDSWIAKAIQLIQLIEDAGGVVTAEAFGRKAGHSAYVLAFEIDHQEFRIEWPVLVSKSGEEAAARRQAATFIYHDVKAKYMALKVKGPRVAFLEYMVLPDGRPAGMLAAPQLMQAIPRLLTE